MSMLGVLFIGLKLTGHIDWSWWWVTAPLWAIPAATVTTILVGALTLVVAQAIQDARHRNS